MCKYIFHFRSRALLFNVFALENTNFHITLGVQNTSSENYPLVSHYKINHSAQKESTIYQKEQNHKKVKGP